jgi:predicted ATP-binding protein involved in virulence
LVLKETDIHLGAEGLFINVSIKYNDSKGCKWWVKKGFETLRGSKDRNYTELKNYIVETIEHLEQNPLFNLPIICFYSISRMNFDDTVKATSSQSRYKYNQFSAYKKSLFTGLNSFSDFIIWFEEEEGYEDKMRLETDNNYRNPKLEVIRNAIERFLNGFESMSSTFKNIRIKKERNENNFKYRNSIMSSLVIKKNDKDFQLEQLSSGEKMMIMLIVDIARRISIANPSLKNPLEGEGIILIDEIDLHLHPQWQREIIPALTNTFPNCQFIITTHSPQVLSQVKKENIFIIEGNSIVSNPPHTYGKDANSILYEIFDTLERPKYIQDKLDECYKLIEMEKFGRTKEILKELTELLDQKDSEIVKIKSLLTFYEQ